nr:hypothetical protein Iba_chr07aCG7020 [Ipomoea batatas]
MLASPVRLKRLCWFEVRRKPTKRIEEPDRKQEEDIVGRGRARVQVASTTAQTMLAVVATQRKYRQRQEHPRRHTRPRSTQQQPRRLPVSREQLFIGGGMRLSQARRSAMRDFEGDNELPSSPLPTLPSSYNGKATFGGEASSGGASAAAAVALGGLSRRSTRWQWHVLAKSRQPQQWKPRVSRIRLHQRRRVGNAAAGAPPGDKGVVFLLLLSFSLDVTKGRRRATAASGGS